MSSLRRWPKHLGLLVALGVISPFGHAGVNDDFRHRLTQMLQLTEKSIKVLASQITESLNAPFLPDLYLQLAELQSQKSNTLYYIQMEIQKSSDIQADKEFSPVVTAQKEAIYTYEMILKDFPQFKKRSNVLYRLALAEKSIDQIPDFVKTASQVLKTYPSSEEAMRCQILLGQYYFENHDYVNARKLLTPVCESTFIYERNLARYKVGLIELETDHFSEGLHFFEKVILDPELKEQDNPYEVSRKQKSTKSDLKREALIDSIRAYTHVYEKTPNPIGYYSKLAPNEILFQEIIEKIAIRYVQQKQYHTAIQLLRTLSERTVDPEKAINIYRNILMIIPASERINIPAHEIRFILEKYDQWKAYYEVPKNLLTSTYHFLEKQLRELGTTSHAFYKQAKKLELRSLYLERAKEFYLLYLSFFYQAPEASIISTDLADVYFNQGDYLKCGDYYLRTFQGEFGKSNQRRALIDNAIICLEKKFNRTYFENLRIHGLLIKSIHELIAFDHSKISDPALNFLLVKTEYEQGFFPEAFNRLYQFIKNYHGSKETIDAAELILDYYNTRSDYKALQDSAGRLLGMHLESVSAKNRNSPNSIQFKQFNEKLQKIKKSAYSKLLQEKIKETSGYDEFSQGKSYLEVALHSGNVQLQNAVLREALVKSKRERDFETFLKTASIMATKERDPSKKIEIIRSIAREQIRVTQFYAGMATLAKIYQNSTLSLSNRQEAFDEANGILLILRDFDSILEAKNNPLWKSRGSATRNRLKTQLIDLMDSPTPVKPELSRLLLTQTEAPDPESLLSLYKARYKLEDAMNQEVSLSITRICARGNKLPACAWRSLEKMDGRLDPSSPQAFEKGLQSAPHNLGGVQGQAAQFEALSTALKDLQGSGDLNLEISVIIRLTELYRSFAGFLEKTAQSNAELKIVLLQKAQETRSTAQSYASQCSSIADRSTDVTPAARYCSQTQRPPFRKLIEENLIQLPTPSRSDPHGGSIEEKERELFGAKEDADSIQLNLAKFYLERREFSQAAAAASFGLSSYPSLTPEFHAVLGCSLLPLGFYSEAAFHLRSSTDGDPLKLRCNAQLTQMKGRI